MIAKYLDCSTTHLTPVEMARITEAPLRVIAHEYGAWVHVPSDLDDVEDAFAEVGDFPALFALLRFARALDPEIAWVNLDCDAETVPGVPTFT